MKRKISLALGCLLAVSSFAACTPSSGNETTAKSGAVMEAEKSTAYKMSQIGEDVLPIALYVSPTSEYTYNGVTYSSLITEEVYGYLKDLGVNLIMQHYENGDDVIKQIELCSQFDMGFLYAPHTGYDFHKILDDGTIIYYDDETFEQSERDRLREAFEYAATTLSKYDAYVGVKFWDEQGLIAFDAARMAKELYEDVMKDNGVEDKTGLFYCNLLGSLTNQEMYAMNPYHNSYAIPPEIASIPEFVANPWGYYIDQFSKVTGSPVLSYDVYPFSGAAGITHKYLASLGEAAKTASENKVAFWNFVQGSAFEGTTRRPNYNELAYNFNTSLMYGATGLEIFNVITPSEFIKDYVNSPYYGNGGDTPINVYGKPDGNYYEMQKVLQDIQAIDHILMNSVYKGVMQSDDSLVTGVQLPALGLLDDFNQVKSIEADFTYAMAGCFNYQGKTALYVVNTSILPQHVSNVYVNLKDVWNGYYVKNGQKTEFSSNQIVIPKLEAGEAAMVVLG